MASSGRYSRKKVVKGISLLHVTSCMPLPPHHTHIRLWLAPRIVVLRKLLSLVVLMAYVSMSARQVQNMQSVQSMQRAGTVHSVTVTQTDLRSNFSIMDSLCASAAQRFCAALPGGTYVTDLSLTVTNHSASWLVRQHVLAAQNKAHSGAVIACTVNIAECGVLYTSLPEKDSLQRRCRVELRGIAGLEVVSPVEYMYVDTIARADVSRAEYPRHEAFTAALPAPQLTMWDEILEPLLVVGALATTVVLLFTVRSQ